MPVFQTNLWVCEGCGVVASTARETSPYGDPVVAPPEGEQWEYVSKDGAELLVCPDCQVPNTIFMLEE